MRLLWLLAALFLLPARILAQEALTYRVEYNLSKPSEIHVTLRIADGADAPLTLVMPRAVPGGYAQRPYDPFVENVHAFTPDGKEVDVQRENLGPRWKIGKSGGRIERAEYDLNVARMEREIFSAADASKIRDEYAGLLGYSVFAYLEGRKEQAIELEVAGPAGWPVFSTLAPQVPANVASLTTKARDYYALADSQIVMGPKLLLRRMDSSVPLFLPVYAESAEHLPEEA